MRINAAGHLGLALLNF